MNVNRGYCETHFSWSGCSEKDSDWLEIKGNQKLEQDTVQCQNYPLSNKKRIDTLLGGGMLQKSGGHLKINVRVY
jgi:hypothetical protein